MKIKTIVALAAFSAAFALAVLINNATGNYWIQITHQKSFTFHEAESLVGKRISDTCLKKPEGNRGLVTHQVKSNSGERLVNIKLEFK